MMATDVVALYVCKNGIYPRIVEDWYDENRDARTYTGDRPVIAHPPCGPWGRLRHLYRGSEHDCGPRAVEQVRRFGGVLEHPAGSQLWEACGLPEPEQCCDEHGGYSIEVDQVEWGHVARKRTWLYLVGVPREALEEPPFPGREPTHWVSGGGTGRGKPPPGIKICSAQQRRRTPPLFAEYLVRLAMSVRLGQAYRERFAR